MGNLVYPTLSGRTLPSGRTVLPPPVRVRTTPSQREFRARDSLLPRYQYTVSYEWLRTRASSPDLQTLLGFYNQVGGPFDSFLYLDPDDNTATAEAFGTGDGTTTSFTLSRAFGGFAEPVSAVVGAPVVKVGGTTTAVTIAAGTPTVTFATAPASGAALTWSGQFYRRCRFVGDKLDTEKFLAGLFNAKRVEFISVKG